MWNCGVIGFNLWKMSTMVKRISRIYLLPARKHLTSFLNSSRHFCVCSLTSGLILRKREEWCLDPGSLQPGDVRSVLTLLCSQPQDPCFLWCMLGIKEERMLSRSFECLNWKLPLLLLLGHPLALMSDPLPLFRAWAQDHLG